MDWVLGVVVGLEWCSKLNVDGIVGGGKCNGVG